MTRDNTKGLSSRANLGQDNRTEEVYNKSCDLAAQYDSKQNEGDSLARKQVREERAKGDYTTTGYPYFNQDPEQQAIENPPVSDAVAGGRRGNGGGGRRPPRQSTPQASRRSPASGAVAEVRRQGYPKDIAEDAVQEAYLSIPKAPREVLADPVRKRAYLRSAALRIASRMKKERDRYTSFETPDGQPDPAVVQTLQEDADEHRAAWPPDQIIEEQENDWETVRVYCILKKHLPARYFDALNAVVHLNEDGRRRLPPGQGRSSGDRQVLTRARVRARRLLRRYGIQGW